MNKRQYEWISTKKISDMKSDTNLAFCFCLLLRSTPKCRFPLWQTGGEYSKHKGTYRTQVTKTPLSGVCSGISFRLLFSWVNLYLFFIFPYALQVLHSTDFFESVQCIQFGNSTLPAIGMFTFVENILGVVSVVGKCLWSLHSY